jgi:hypothetical protein
LGDIGKKIFLMSGKVAIAMTGYPYIDVKRPDGTVVEFRAADVVNRMWNSFTVETPLSTIERAVTERIVDEFHKFAQAQGKDGLIVQVNPDNYHFSLIVAGFEGKVPQVHQIRFDYTHDLSRFEPKAIAIDGASAEGDRLFSFGINQEIESLRSNVDPMARDSASKLGAERQLHPSTMRGSFPTEASAIETSHDLINLERHFHEDAVGPPIFILILRRNGEPEAQYFDQ